MYLKLYLDNMNIKKSLYFKAFLLSWWTLRELNIKGNVGKSAEKSGKVDTLKGKVGKSGEK